MAINELTLDTKTKANVPVDKIFGVLAILCAPTLLMQFLIGGIEQNSSSPNNNLLVSALGVLYIGGWMLGAVGMFRQKLYGENLAAKIVFALQMIFLTLAFLFSVQETMSISYENGGGTFFFVCDMGYPASHLFMFVVGICVLLTRRWRGFTRFAPFAVGAALPVTMALGGFLGITLGMILFGGLTTLGLATIGWKIFRN